MSKIDHLSVDWCERWANRPRFLVTFEPAPPIEAYRELRDGILLSIVGERAEFLCYTGPGTGYGGRRIPIKMADGSRRVLIGPWSSNSGEVNTRVQEAEHVVEAVDDERYSTAVTVAGILRYIDDHPDCGFGLAQVTWGGSIWYEPTLNGSVKADRVSPVKVVKLLR